MAPRSRRVHPAAEIAAVVVGAAVGTLCAIAAWDRFFAPACEGGRRSGDLLEPVCVSPGAPLWLVASGAVLGVVLGLIAVRASGPR